SWWPGIARSRENANIIRDADVTDARPQKNWATQAIRSRNSAHLVLIAFCQMYCTAKVYWSAVLDTGPGIANVTATSRMNPKLSDLWWSGTTIRTTTITSTPAMCHQAEMLLIIASRRGMNVLISPCRATITV